MRSGSVAVPIHIIRSHVAPTELQSMLDAHGSFIKLAVDLRRRVVAGGGAMHADCEAALLDDGSASDDVWGADWYPDTRSVGFESFINIRPRLGNRSLEVQDPARRLLIETIVRERFE